MKHGQFTGATLIEIGVYMYIYDEGKITPRLLARCCALRGRQIYKLASRE